MKNEGQIKMNLPRTQIGLSVDERNALTKRHYHAIVAKPTFKLNQKVVPNELGVTTQVLDEDQFAIVTKIDDDKLMEETGNRMEIQCFDKNGHLVRMATDPRFFKSINEKEN
jgi:hypothetical protein